MQQDALTEIAIHSEILQAAISPDGAELRSLRHASLGEMMWQGHPDTWEKTSPLLFPVIGRVSGDEIRIDGRPYPMPQHGFAQALRFDTNTRTANSCALTASDNEATRASYPFAFTLAVDYTVNDATLTVEAIVHNTGERAMPASFGFHPGFRWPLAAGVAKDRHRLRFDADDIITVARPLHRLLGPSSEMQLPDGVLPLDEALFERGAIVALAPESRSIRFSTMDEKVAIEVAFEGLAHLAIWMRPGGDFLCIEPWQGHADPHGFTGDFFDKPGLDILDAGGRKRYRMAITFSDGRRD